jgi:enamine deaminase RidA (YjgF/YER057c/UK114 family)
LNKEIINPSTLGNAVGPFARSVRVGDILYISGTSALSHLSGPLEQRALPADFDEQARLTFTNIEKVLVACGLTMRNLFKVVVILKRIEDYARLNALRAELFPGGEVASTTFIADLIRPDMLIEVEASAFFP